MSLKKAFKEVNGMYLAAAEIDCEAVTSDHAARIEVLGTPGKPGKLVEFAEEHRGAFIGLKGMDKIQEGETADLLREAVRKLNEEQELDIHFHDGSYSVRPIDSFVNPKR